jgi:hypothetical protein
MATKKLTVEVDADVSKAKRKVGALGDDVSGGASPVGGAAEKTAKSMEKAAKSVGDLGEASNKASVNALNFARGFAGMAAGMAMTYAARSLPQGRERDMVEYGGGILAGAGAGAAAGAPLGLPGMAAGAVIGGIVGGVKTYLDKSGDNAAWTKEWQTSERRYKEGRDWQRQFASLTDVGKDLSNLSAKIKAAEEELAKYQKAEEKIRRTVDEFGAKGEYENADHQRESLAGNRARQEQLEAAIKSMKALESDGEKTPRGDMSALDALSKIGGNFGGGEMRELEKTGREQLDVLRSIDRKTNGGAIWQ